MRFEGKREPDQPPVNLGELYFNKCPYDHVVIPNAALHPSLQQHLKLIDELRVFGRAASLMDCLAAGVSTLGVYGVANAKASFGVSEFSLNVGRMAIAGVMLVPPALWELQLSLPDYSWRLLPVLMNYLTHCPDEDRDQLVKALEVFRCGPWARYHPVNVATQITTSVIDRILNNAESPFASIDAPGVISNHHFGIIDNRLNLILIKHPDAKNSRELRDFVKFLRKMQWLQPFQRCRFALNEPEIREEDNTRGLAALRDNKQCVLFPNS